MVAENDISAQLTVNDTNQMLAQILLEIKVTNYTLIAMVDSLNKGLPFIDEPGGIRQAITANDVLNRI